MRGWVCLLLLMAASAAGEPGPAGRGTQWCHLVGESMQPHCHPRKPEAAAKACCEVCLWKKACGDGCVEILEPCSLPPGCACNTLELPRVPASESEGKSCCVVCWKGKPCGDGCVGHNEACAKPPGCACAPR